MKLQALALAAGLVVASSANANITLALTDSDDLGDFGAPTSWGETFEVTAQGTIDHSLTFTITEPLFAGSGVSDIPLSFFSIVYKNITDLSAKIYVNNNGSNALYTFVPNGDLDHLVLPDNSFFAIGDYTLKIGGNSVGQGGGFYSVAAVTVPVPEPETWAMLLAGLGLVGFAVRRRASTY
jgi:hypothetical protein